MKEPMLVTTVPIDTVIPYARNPRKNQEAVKAVVASIQEFGFRQPIVVDENNVVVVGHTRLSAARQLGYTEVPVHMAVGLTEQQIKAYRIADNKTNEFAEWDPEMLTLELEETGDLYTGFTEDDIAALGGVEGLTGGKGDTTYTQVIASPVYEPTRDTKPLLSDLYTTTKYDQLLLDIDTAIISDDEKAFLKAAAARHVVFNYQEIAEYYCHSTPEVQKLFEQSALVIIDFNDAVDAGFVKMTEAIDSLYENRIMDPLTGKGDDE